MGDRPGKGLAVLLFVRWQVAYHEGLRILRDRVIPLKHTRIDSMRQTDRPKKLRTVEVAPSTYSPTKAELEEEFRIDASPGRLAKALLSPVEVREKARK